MCSHVVWGRSLRHRPPLTPPSQTHPPTQVAFDAQGREWDDASLYWSDFSEYPEDVQDAFTQYLAER